MSMEKVFYYLGKIQPSDDKGKKRVKKLSRALTNKEYTKAYDIAEDLEEFLTDVSHEKALKKVLKYLKRHMRNTRLTRPSPTTFVMPMPSVSTRFTNVLNCPIDIPAPTNLLELYNRGVNDVILHFSSAIGTSIHFAADVSIPTNVFTSLSIQTTVAGARGTQAISTLPALARFVFVYQFWTSVEPLSGRMVYHHLLRRIS